jgi:hypothetical protein
MYTETKIAKLLVASLLQFGNTISVNDGEAFTVKRSKDAKAIVAALATTDEDRLLVRDNAGNRIGSVWLIWGNGIDLISDYSESLEYYVDRAQSAVERLRLE